MVNSFSQIKEEGKWREDVQGKYVLIMSGKHAGKIAKFCHWQGTIAIIRPLVEYTYDSDKSETAIPIETYGSVLKS